MDDYRALFDLTPLPAYVFDDLTLRFLAVNTAAIERYGYSRDEFLRLSLEDIRPPENRHSLVSSVRDQIDIWKYHGAWRHVTRSGEAFDVEIVSERVTFHDRAAHFVVAMDVTERNRAQQAAAERAHESNDLSRRVWARARARREEDRTRLARELHDQLGQALAALKIDLCWLADVAAAGQISEERSLTKIEAMTRLVDDTIWRVRRISGELRPPVLDKLGLIAAIEWEVRAFERRAGVRTIIESTPDHVVLDGGRATAVFRIFQESLANVASHAQATRVTVAVAQEDQRLMLTVTDNGRGIPPQRLAGNDSLGLLGMRERAELIGGTVDVRRQRPRGTRVTVSIPLADRRATPRDDWT